MIPFELGTPYTDVAINSGSNLNIPHIKLFLYINKLSFFSVQDVCLITALAILLLSFFTTYVFQASIETILNSIGSYTGNFYFQTGLVYLLYERFRTTLVICMLYFILTTVLHIWSLITRWNNSRYNWSTAFFILFVIQRLSKLLLKF